MDLNIGLNIIDRLDNGYHQIETLIQEIDLYDVIDINIKKTPGNVIFSTTGNKINCKNENNSCYIMASILKEKYNIILHGIDPDQSINLKETKIKFEYFEVTDLESFETTEKYDLILLNMVMEHIKDNFGSFKKLKGLLSEKGIIVCRQPSNLHPFSILNRILSHDLKEIVLKTFLPWSKKGARGWKSYYHKCNYIGFKNLCKKNHL